MWFELFGPPGVGKSTVFAALPPGRVSTRSVRGKPPKAWQGWISRTEAAFGQGDARRAPPRLASFRRKVRQAAGTRPDTITDDLLAQRGQSMAAAGCSDLEIARYYRTMPELAGVVILLNDADEVRARNRARRRDLSSETGRALQVVLGFAEPILIARQIPMLVMETRLPPHRVAREVIRWVDAVTTARAQAC